MTDLHAADVPRIARRLAAAFEENRDWLNELDARIGDGDHGLSMARGFAAVADLLESSPPQSVSDALLRGAVRFNEVSGSTIGILMFSAMREAGKAAAGLEAIGIADLARMLEAAVAGIRTRGKSEPGQKTILDSLHPALVSLQSDAARGRAAAETLRAAVRAAEEGAESTRGMVPAVGRARWFQERSKGELDPGAVSGSIIVKTVAACLLGEG